MKRASRGLALGLCLLIILLPALQLGFTYYLSAHLVAVLVLCAIVARYPGKAQLDGLTCIALLLLMAAPLLWTLDSAYFAHSALRNLREFVCLLLLLAVIQK